MENNHPSRQLDITGEISLVAKELYELAASINEDQFNTEPFTGSWTPAQLVVHVTKSNNGIIQGLDMQGSTAVRKHGSRIEELKKIFLNFDQKLQSPAFILPKPGHYEKQATLDALQQSNQQLNDKGTTVNLSDVIVFQVLGEISKLELLYFVLYHTQRHVHQLKNMIQHFQ